MNDESKMKMNLLQYDKEDKDFIGFAVALKLSVAYASNIGGIGTLIGCGPNIVFKGQAESSVAVINLVFVVGIC